MEKKRIEYIDHLRGLALMGVVWFHTAHPAFLDFSWRIPLFFFISGIFFRPYEPKVFFKKKINQLLVPTVFFYVLYCLFYVAMWFGKFRSFTEFNPHMLIDVVDLYSGSESFTMNPPLWFIFALLDIQLVMYCLLKLTSNRLIILFVAVAASVIGVKWFYQVPSPFMISRSTPYFIYFALGFVMGMPVLNVIDQGKGREYRLLLVLSMLFFMGSIIGIYALGLNDSGSFGILYYMAVISFIILLIYVMQKVYKYRICAPFDFYGKNTFVLLGIHEMVLTIMLLCVNHFFDGNSLWLGIVQVVITLCIAYPITLLCNKYIPHLVGKRDLL